jgi:hypothetical protein
VRVHLAAATLEGPGAFWVERRWRNGESGLWVLVSYLELGGPGRRNRTYDALKDTVPGSLIVDSGLFSLMFGTKKGMLPRTFDAYRDYTLRYIEALDQAGYRGLFVESDTQKLLGMDATHRLREEFKPFGGRVIYVWHAPEGLDGLDKLALEQDYIALSVPELRVTVGGGTHSMGSDRYKQAVFALLKRIHKTCADAGKLPPRIHLLGCTVPELMMTPLAYTCDSTSWISGVRYNQSSLHTGNGKILTFELDSPEWQRWLALVAKRFPEEIEALKKRTVYYRHAFASMESYADFQQWLDSRVTVAPTRPIPGIR